MRAVVITKHGDLSVLQVQERPDPPPPTAGQVRIAVRAAGVNFADHLARVGLYPDAPKPPSVVGYEVAGTIEAVGDGVDPARVGERVFAGTRFGGYAEIVNVQAADAVSLPDALSFEQGAAIPVNYATAWAALHGYGSLRPGERVLIHAAAGGVGIAAIQLAKAGGAEIHGTASPGKHQRLAELGVDRAIDYRRDGWWKDLPPYDIVLDALGGKSLKRSYDLLRPGGRLVAYGFSAMQQGDKRSLRTALPQLLPMLRGFNLVKQLSESKAVIGLNMLALWDDRGTFETVDRSTVDGDRGRRSRACSPCRGAVRQSRLRRTGSWPRGRTSARSCWCLRGSFLYRRPSVLEKRRVVCADDQQVRVAALIELRQASMVVEHCLSIKCKRAIPSPSTLAAPVSRRGCRSGRTHRRRAAPSDDRRRRPRTRGRGCAPAAKRAQCPARSR